MNILLKENAEKAQALLAFLEALPEDFKAPLNTLPEYNEKLYNLVVSLHNTSQEGFIDEKKKKLKVSINVFVKVFYECSVSPCRDPTSDLGGKIPIDKHMNHLRVMAYSFLKVAEGCKEVIGDLRGLGRESEKIAEKLSEKVEEAYSKNKYKTGLWESQISQYKKWTYTYNKFHCLAVFIEERHAKEFQYKLSKVGLSVLLEKNEKGNWHPYITLTNAEALLKESGVPKAAAKR